MTRPHRRLSIVLALAAGLAAAVPARALDFRVDDRALALAAPAAAPAPTDVPARGLRATAPHGGGTPSPLVALGKSLLVPGWGQLATGHKTQAAIFAGLEFGTWVTYGTFQRQGALRRSSYFDTARLFAGIDLSNKPDNYRSLVATYQSSDVYNQYVVMREAAYFFSDSAQAAQFIQSHHIAPANGWSWDSFDAFLDYRAQRRSSEQAFQRARYAVGFAVVNRVVSGIAAAREAASARKSERSSSLDGVPGRPRASLAVDVAPGPGLVPDARLACVVRF